MRRWLLYTSASTSLLLCLATAALWCRSYWTADGIWYQGKLDLVVAMSNRGQLMVHDDTLGFGFAGAGAPGWSSFHDQAATPVDWRLSPAMRWSLHLLGFSFYARRGGSVSVGPKSTTSFWSFWQISVPDAAVGPLFAILPVVAARRIRSGRLLLGHCRRCGYDLRGTPARCPECGMPSVTPAVV